MSAFYFNYAAGLLALLGLVVPVAIHLWNRRPGRTVQVGSLRWLTATANRRLRNLRLEQLLLLLLRSVVVALVALAVAAPHWRHPQAPRPVQGAVLLAPDVLRPAVLPAVRPVVDSLRRRHYELRLLAPGLPRISDTAWVSADSLATLPSGAALATDNLWTRVRQAADSLPGRPLHVVASLTARHFAGLRPALPARVRWQPVPLPDSAVWLAAASASRPDTLRLLVGRSNAEATTLQPVLFSTMPRTARALPVAGLPGLRYQPATAGRPAEVQQPNRAAAAVQTAPWRAVLHATAPHAAAARCVQAALRAAALALPTPLELRVVTPAAPLPAQVNWLFWLSDEPVPAAWRARVRAGASLWQEAAGTGAPVATALDLTAWTSAPPVSLRRLDTAAVPARAQVLWQDGAGRPALTRRLEGRGQAYHLRTRLQTTWSDLPDSPALPALLLDLLHPAASSTAHDLRQLDPRQVRSVPPAAAPVAAPVAPLSKAEDLRPWLVLLAALLFGAERAWAHRRAALVSPSTSAPA